MSGATCFFCQNLLSDFIEGILPSARHEDVKCHLDSCPACAKTLTELQQTMDVLHTIPHRPLSHEMALRITEAAQAGSRSALSRTAVSRVVLFGLAPVLCVVTAFAVFPETFPWIERWRAQSQAASFVRYFPLLQGVNEIIEEQANWLGIREPFSRSVWEEGGLSPEEFEKSFQNQSKGTKEEK